MTGIRIHDQASLRAAAHAIREDIGCDAVLITRGEAGMALLMVRTADHHSHHGPRGL